MKVIKALLMEYIKIIYIIVIKEDDFLIYYYQGIAKKCHFLKKSSEVFHIISSIHDDFFNVNFTLENLNFKGITEVIINFFVNIKILIFKLICLMLFIIFIFTKK